MDFGVLEQVKRYKEFVNRIVKSKNKNNHF